MVAKSSFLLVSFATALLLAAPASAQTPGAPGAPVSAPAPAPALAPASARAPAPAPSLVPAPAPAVVTVAPGPTTVTVPAASAVTVVVPATAQTAEAPAMAVPPVQLTVPWNGPTGKGVSFGFEEGAWSGVWGNGLRVFVPFFEQIGGHNMGSIGMTLRAIFAFGGGENLPFGAPLDHFGGRFELTGRSPVFLNLVRLYGGGGVEVFSAFGSDCSGCGGNTTIRPINHQAMVGGGGHFGFEFFLNRRYSFFLEVGGHSGVDNGLPGGETVIAGMNLYPFFQ